MLDREIFKALQDAVGERWVSEDPGILETYRCVPPQSSAHYGPYDQRTPTPQAVVIPGTVEEVQAVIRICNKYGIVFKASSTFWSAHGYIGSDYGIQIDMRRFNEFKIDPKNMIFTCGSQINHATAQAEAMKYGLTYNIPGVGCSSSIVASTAGWAGAGPNTCYAGGNYQNLLCAEWVLPDGEILYTGSAGAGLDWFTDEGIGPGTRGIIRSGHGMKGEMGICTRMSFKLAPWPGPKTMQTVGTVPVYRAQMPDNIKFYALCFDNWDDWVNATDRLNSNEVLWMGHRQFGMFGRDLKAAMLEILTDTDRQLADIPVLLADPKVQATTKSLKIEMYVIIAGMNKEDLAWKEAAIDEVLETYHGWKDERLNEKEMNEFMMTYFIRLGRKNLNYVYCGAYEGSFGLCMNNVYDSVKICEEAFTLKKYWEDNDTFFAQVGGDSAMGSITGSGGDNGAMAWEFFCHFDSHDHEEIPKVTNFMDNVSKKFQNSHGIGYDFCNSTEGFRRPDGFSWTQDQMNEMWGSRPNPAPYTYQWKMREAFNPNHLNGSYYATVDPEYLHNKKK